MKIILTREEVDAIVVNYVMEKLDMSCGNPKPMMDMDAHEDIILEGYEVEIND